MWRNRKKYQFNSIRITSLAQIIKLYLQIVMRKTFTEKFHDQQKMEQEISKAWGYVTSPSHLNSMKESKKVDKQVSINKHLKPLRMDDNKPMMSTQHLELIKEIAEIEHQKMMRRRAEQRNQAEFNFTKLLNERVREYNYLIDHKHIKQKNSEATKKVLKLKPKSEAQLIVEEIKRKNKELLAAEDIEKQFQLNKKINLLYRQYKDKMYEDKSPDYQQRRLHQTIITNSSRNNRLRTKSITSEQRAKNYGEPISKVRIKHEGENHIDLQNKFQDDKPTNIKEPYMNEDDIRKNNEFKRNTENRNELLEMYKFKITKLKNFHQNPKLHLDEKNMSKKKSMSMNGDSGKKPENAFFEKNQRETPEDHASIVISQLKEKRQTQLKYFTTFLEKRNRRFKKPWGNKILIKFDSKSQAKQMLEGSSETLSPNKTQYFSSGHNSSEHKSKKSTSVRTIPKNISEEDRMIYESLQQEKNDPHLYEIMCKNQKVNLFLKAKKRNKE